MYFFDLLKLKPVIVPSKQISFQTQRVLPKCWQTKKLVSIENARYRKEGQSQGNYLGQADKYPYLECNQCSSFSKSLSIGSGKSSLFRILCELWSPLSGTSCFSRIILNISWAKQLHLFLSRFFYSYTVKTVNKEGPV